MTAFPPHWQLKTVADVGQIDLGRQRHPHWHHGPDMRPYLRVANVFEDHIDVTDLKTMDFSGVFERYRLSPGDVLLNEGQTPELLGRPAIYRGNPPDVAFTNSLLRFRAGSDVLPEWALVVFRRHMHFGRFTRESRITTNIAHLSAGRLKTVEFPVPPLDEQRRIVDILEDHLSRLDAASTYLRTVLKRSALMRASVLHAAATGRLTSTGSGGASRAELLAQRRVLCPQGMKRGRPKPAAPDDLGTTLDIPDRWTLMSLEEVTDPVRTISYGILKPGPDIEGGVPYVRVLNMRDNRLDVANLHRTSPEIAAAYGRASLIGGDVLVSIRGTYGRVVQVPESLAGANITQDAARLAFIESILPEFARVYLMSPVAQRHMKRVARGVAVKGVNIADLRAMPFPVPPADEQTRIVERAEELLSDLVEAERTATNGLRRSRSLRRSLLDAAFTGRLTRASSDMDRVEEFAGV